MNLRDVQQRPLGRTLPDMPQEWWDRFYRTAVEDTWQVWGPEAPPRMVPVQRRETRVALNDFREDMQHAQPAFEARPEYEAVFVALERQWEWLQRAGYRRDERELPRVGLQISHRDWNLLLRWLPREQLMTNFGPEGALLNFRGVPLHVVGR